MLPEFDTPSPLAGTILRVLLAWAPGVATAPPVRPLKRSSWSSIVCAWHHGHVWFLFIHCSSCSVTVDIQYCISVGDSIVTTGLYV